MKLPNAENAFIDDAKLVDYCLNFEHLEGKLKALVFEKKLGITAEIFFVLKNEILEAVHFAEAVLKREDNFGRYFQVDFDLSYLDKTACVRTAWIVRKNENFPRLTSCYII